VNALLALQLHFPDVRTKPVLQVVHAPVNYAHAVQFAGHAVQILLPGL